MYSILINKNKPNFFEYNMKILTHTHPIYEICVLCVLQYNMYTDYKLLIALLMREMYCSQSCTVKNKIIMHCILLMCIHYLDYAKKNGCIK